MIKTVVFTKWIKVAVSALLTVTILTGCGFHLRGDYLLPDEMQTLYVSSQDPHGELTRFVKTHLKDNDVKVMNKSGANIPELRILKDLLNRRTLSLFENGQVAEYELTYSVRYEVRFENKETQRYNFDLTRNYQDDPDRALAKSRELSLLRKEMRIEAASTILRNLASTEL
ncbi:LPS assembly lipoprotein LptE [Thalassotalea psychrophila]|uniref:LPS-assembly lipoprotein LptE n=1 Tax=Thalassotalea psychrophila TaxID=3065647 RepID=A0ABY9TRB2_9GAMM|nr:LPS assembly lipoprotein LptE [Colwelliaceae bacterium SQ149]